MQVFNLLGSVNMRARLAFHRPSLFVSLLTFFLTLAASAHFSFSQNDSNKIRNFGQINENYFRGGQPDAEHFALLKRMGIKTVIDLQKDPKDKEKSWVQNAGMKYVQIPLSTTRPATAEQTEYFLQLVNDPDNLPVFVHCAAGKHRTGEMTAIYRITHDSWSADRAYAEMKKYGYYSFPNHGSLKDYVFIYHEKYQRAVKKGNMAPKPVPEPAQTQTAF